MECRLLDMTCVSPAFLVESVVNCSPEVHHSPIPGLEYSNYFTHSPQLSHVKKSAVWGKLSQQKVCRTALPASKFITCVVVYQFAEGPTPEFIP